MGGQALAGKVSLEGFELREGYAYFRPEGPMSVDRLQELLKEVMKTCQEHRTPKVLVNATLLSHKPLTTVDWFRWGSGLAAFWDRGIRLAFVGRPDQTDRERFGSLVAQNRGLHYGLFMDETEGVAWLLQTKER